MYCSDSNSHVNKIEYVIKEHEYINNNEEICHISGEIFDIIVE